MHPGWRKRVNDKSFLCPFLKGSGSGAQQREARRRRERTIAGVPTLGRDRICQAQASAALCVPLGPLNAISDTISDPTSPAEKEDIPLNVFYSRCIDYIAKQGASDTVVTSPVIERQAPDKKRILPHPKVHVNGFTAAAGAARLRALERDAVLEASRTSKRPVTAVVTRLSFEGRDNVEISKSCSVRHVAERKAEKQPLSALSCRHKMPFLVSQDPERVKSGFGVDDTLPPPRPLSTSQEKLLRRSRRRFEIARAKQKRCVVAARRPMSSPGLGVISTVA